MLHILSEHVKVSEFGSVNIMKRPTSAFGYHISSTIAQLQVPEFSTLPDTKTLIYLNFLDSEISAKTSKIPYK